MSGPYGGVPDGPTGQVPGMPEDRESSAPDTATRDPLAAATPDAQAHPVPAPGHPDSSAGPGVRSAQGASPEHAVQAGEKGQDSDTSGSGPGAWTAIAAPGKPDGEVDTRG